MYIVSACLAGVECRYDGRDNTDDTVYRLVKEGRAIPLCPEVLGGLSIPRVPCEIVSNGGGLKVINKEGGDVTAQFIRGAKKTVEVARVLGIEAAILKARSPSCGHGKIYDGTFTGRLIDGDGITCRMLLDSGIEVYTEEELKKF